MFIPTYRFNDIIFSLLALGWGIVLILPGDTFEIVYSRLSSIEVVRLPELLFGSILIACSIPNLLQAPLWLKKLSHIGLFGLWSFVAFLILAPEMNPSTLLASSSYLVIAVFHARRFWHLTQEIRVLRS